MVHQYDLSLTSIVSVVDTILYYMTTEDFKRIEERKVALNLSPFDNKYQISFDKDVIKKTGIYSIDFYTLQNGCDVYFNKDTFNFVYSINVNCSFFVKQPTFFAVNYGYKTFYQVNICKVTKKLKHLDLSRCSLYKARLVLNKDLELDGVTIKIYNSINLYSGNQSFLCKPLDNNSERTNDASDEIIYHCNNQSISKYAIDMGIFKNCILNIETYTVNNILQYIFFHKEQMNNFIKNNNKFKVDNIVVFVLGSEDFNYLELVFRYKDYFLDFDKLDIKFSIRIYEEVEANKFVHLSLANKDLFRNADVDITLSYSQEKDKIMNGNLKHLIKAKIYKSVVIH